MQKRCEGFYKEKGSKFIGIAQRCFTRDEAKDILANWKKEHSQAGHLCYAFRLGLKGDDFRANDDGEPANSAGAPILGQLQSFDLTNCLIGVLRYYGGTKLGVGGLINAYRTAAKDAINNGNIITEEVYRWVRIEFDYAAMPGVMNLLKRNQLEMVEKEFESTCMIKTNLPINFADEIVRELSTAGEVKIEELGIY